LFQQIHQSLLIHGTEQGLATGSSGLLQRRLPTGFILLSPTAHGLIADSQPPTDLAVVELLTEQFDRGQASLLQSLKIAANSFWISHIKSNPTGLKKFLYITRHSVVISGWLDDWLVFTGEDDLTIGVKHGDDTTASSINCHRSRHTSTFVD